MRCWRVLVLLAAGAVVTGGCASRTSPPASPPGSGSVRADRGAARFTATAYCRGSVTATGTRPDRRTLAADPSVLPMGTRVQLTGLQSRYNGVYTVGDTGAQIKGRRIDLYMPNCGEAIAFGRRSVRVAVMPRER
jgi:3D (Asp-Asp-Asp) domain-containing protein